MTIQQQIAKLMAHVHAGLYKLVANGGVTINDIGGIDCSWAIEIRNTVPTTGHVRTYYFVRSSNPQQGNNYDIYIFVERETSPGVTVFDTELIGHVAYDMQDHMTTAEFEAELLNYRDTSDPIPLEASAYENDSTFALLKYTANETTKSKFDVTSDKNFASENLINLINPMEMKMSDLVNNYESDLVPKATWDNSLDALIAQINNG